MLYYTYWVHIQDNISANSAKSILQECWEHNQTSYYSGWIGEVQTAGLTHLKRSLTVSLSVLPPFLTSAGEVKRKINKNISDWADRGCFYNFYSICGRNETKRRTDLSV